VAKLKDSASRERALDGLSIALAGQTVNAPEGWAALEPELRKDAKLIALTNKLAVSFRDPAATARAIDAALNGTTTEARVEAIRQIGVLKADKTVTLLLSLVRVQKEPLAIRTEAARSLAAFTDPRIPNELLGGWKGFPKELRGDVIDTLSSRKEWAKALLAAM